MVHNKQDRKRRSRCFCPTTHGEKLSINKMCQEENTLKYRSYIILCMYMKAHTAQVQILIYPKSFQPSQETPRIPVTTNPTQISYKPHLSLKFLVATSKKLKVRVGESSISKVNLLWKHEDLSWTYRIQAKKATGSYVHL